jgi:hypothetical protein
MGRLDVRQLLPSSFLQHNIHPEHSPSASFHVVSRSCSDLIFREVLIISCAMIEVQSDLLPTTDKLSKKSRFNVTAITMASSENAYASFNRSVSMMAYGEAVWLGIHGLSTALTY